MKIEHPWEPRLDAVRKQGCPSFVPFNDEPEGDRFFALHTRGDAPAPAG